MTNQTTTPTTTDQDLCLACGENPQGIGTDELCNPCSIRNEGIMLTQSMIENLTTLRRQLDEQENFFTNATDFEILEASRKIKKMVEAHDATDDAIDRAGYGLATN